MNKNLAENIKKYRKSLGWSQAKLGDFLAVSQQAVGKWENSIAEPDTITINKMAELFQITTDALMGNTNKIRNIVSLSSYNVLKLPIIGTITAGFDGTACEEDLGEIEVLDIALNGYAAEECFVLKIKGNSMYPQFIDGDLVLVHKQNHVDSGTIAVVLYNGDEATVKKVIYKYGENWLDLVPTNPEYMTKHIENEDLEQCRVIGKVISLVLRKI